MTAAERYQLLPALPPEQYEALNRRDPEALASTSSTCCRHSVRRSRTQRQKKIVATLRLPSSMRRSHRASAALSS